MREKLIHIYYGDGKGKTTAAVGLAYRAANRGKRVLFTAFLKGRDSGEFLNDGPFEIDKFDFCNKFWNDLSAGEKLKASDEAKNRLDSLESKIDDYDMVVLDEFLDAVCCGCIDRKYALAFLNNIYDRCEIVITGHAEIQEIFDKADYITEMRKVKHPYDRGIVGRCGIEF